MVVGVVVGVEVVVVLVVEVVVDDVVVEVVVDEVEVVVDVEDVDVVVDDPAVLVVVVVTFDLVGATVVELGEGSFEHFERPELWLDIGRTPHRCELLLVC